MFTIITKHCHGIKRVAIIKPFLIIISIFSLFIFSCKKEELGVPINYSVFIKNNYFETIDSIFIDSLFIDTLKTKQISTPLTLKKQVYQFSCKTFSKLRISAKVKIQGVKENLTIILLSDGKIIIE